MARSPKAPINAAVAKWAREVAGHTVESAARSLGITSERLMAWEAADETPTVNQLRAMAKQYRRTPAFFFLVDPPALDRPTPPDFRGREHGGVSPKLHREIDRALERRKVAIDLNMVPGSAFPDLRLDLADVPDASRRMREYLGVTLEEQTRPGSDASEVLNHWIEALEGRGVLVFHMSRIAPSESRGFSVYERQAPVIVLNGADPPQARCFTLFHEVRHLLERSGAICTLHTNRETERRCNAFAAELLMPRDAMLAELDAEVAVLAAPGEDDPFQWIGRLANRFRVSRDAVAIRLRNLGRLEQADVDAVLRATEERLELRRTKQREAAGGPPHFRTHLRNLGYRYTSSILDALDADEISLTDAAYYLDSKISTIDRMDAELQRRGVR